MQKLDLQTANFTDENIEKLAAMFPHCVTENRDEHGKLKKAIDFDLLKQELSKNIVDGQRERYQINWPGKRQALIAANTPINKTLRPCREESVDFDSTQNLYIEGDNLEALKLLQESYLGKVKMIYIDPPYNTGKDFVYKDNFTADKAEYELDSEQRDEDGGRLVANPETNGRYHSDWLSMMYPRLKLARNLLKDDGVICIHIDENEYVNLEKILSETFGDANNLGTIVWDKRNPKGEVSGVAQQHELISIYCKNREIFKKTSELRRPKENAEKILNKASKLINTSGRHVNETVRKEFKKWLAGQAFSGGEKAYSLIDDEGEVYQSVSMAAPDKPETRSHRPLLHPVTNKACPVPAKGWRFPDKTMDKLLQNKEIVFGIDKSSQPRRKYLLKNNLYESVPSLLYFGGSDNALSLPFDNPKPVAVASRLIESVCSSGDTILDFFSGSATTAHAVMQLNAEDASTGSAQVGNRKFIMVQLPEITDEKSEAHKAGYATIAEIGKERIRRAGKKVKEDNADKVGIDDLDIGFRVLKIDSSNMNDVYYSPDDLSQDLLKRAENNIKADRTAEDLLFQVLLDWGVDLTLPIAREEVEGKTVYFVGDNAHGDYELAACFDDGVDEALVKALAKREMMRVVFKDTGFAKDEIKDNVEQIFKQLSPETEVRAI